MQQILYEFETLDGWTLWTAPNPPEPDKGAPELNIENTNTGAHPLSVYNPPSSLRLVKHWATWHAGVYRQLPVARLSVIKLSAWGRIWDVREGVFPSPSDPSVHAYFRVGLDEAGGVSPTSSGVKWNELRADDQWRMCEVQGVALAQTITIFAGFENGRGCMWNLDKMYAFLDSVQVVIEGDDVPPPPPDPAPGTGVGGITTESVVDKGSYFLVTQRWPKPIKTGP